jgi:very-short-patch-repair endonuclease
VDFYCEAASLAIELDGAGHQSQIEEDAARDRVLSEIGIKVIRIPNVQVRENLDGVIKRVGRQVRAHMGKSNKPWNPT